MSNSLGVDMDQAKAETAALALSMGRSLVEHYGSSGSMETYNLAVKNLQVAENGGHDVRELKVALETHRSRYQP
jgi:hypothetical protein